MHSSLYIKTALVHSFITTTNPHKVKMYSFEILVASLLLISSVTCIPKYEDGGFKPSAIDYADKSAKSHDPAPVATADKRAEETARFGFNGVGDSGAYGGVSSYAPARIDLGGLLLGAVIGIGTILVIPKLLYVLSGSYGAYARSDEGGVGQLMTRLDDALAGQGIDTTSCMQRLLCSYSKQAAEAMSQEHNANNRLDSSQQPSQLDKLVDAISTNQMLNTALAGTAVQEAISAGRNGHNCQRLYRHCSFSSEAALGILAKLATTVNSKSTTSKPSS